MWGCIVNHATSTSGDQVPWGRAGPDYLCDTGSKSCGSHHQSGHGCFSVQRRPLNLYLQTGGTESPPQHNSFSPLFFCVDYSAFCPLPFCWWNVTPLFLCVAWGWPLQERVPFCNQTKDSEAQHSYWDRGHGHRYGQLVPSLLCLLHVALYLVYPYSKLCIVSTHCLIYTLGQGFLMIICGFVFVVHVPVCSGSPESS